MLVQQQKNWIFETFSKIYALFKTYSITCINYLFDELMFPSVKYWSSLHKELQKFVNPEAQNKKSNLDTHTLYIKYQFVYKRKKTTLRMVPILKSFDKLVLKLHTISASDFALSSGTQHIK